MVFSLLSVSCHQLQGVTQRDFFSLDMGDALTRVSSNCHTCASLVTQSSDNPPDVVGISSAAVIKRLKQ